jgi:hypothetical protein
MVYNFFYSPSLGQVYSADQMIALFGINTATYSLSSLNGLGFYPVNETAPDFDNYLYTATPVYTVAGNYADQTWVYTPRPLDVAKANGDWEAKTQAASAVSLVECDCGFSNDIITAAASQDPLARPARYQDVLDGMTAVTDQLDSNLTAIDSATDVDEINDIVNPPNGVIFTGRGSGLGPEDLNVSYYTVYNSLSLPESDTELYVTGTSTVIAYGSGGPGKFDSAGNCFNPGDYNIQIRNSKTGFVIAEFEVPLAPAGVDVAF